MGAFMKNMFPILTSRILAGALLLIIIILTYYHFFNRTSDVNTFKVTYENVPNTLNYSGTLQFSQSSFVISPSDATVSKVNFDYGQEVKKDQLIFELTSGTLLKSYRDALSHYMQAKSTFLDSEMAMQESDALFKEQLISSDEYHSKQSAYFQAQIGLANAEGELNDILPKMGQPSVSKTLTLKNAQKEMNTLLKSNNKYTLIIRSPQDGIILAPDAAGSDSILSKALKRGSEVKEGNTLAIIATLDTLLIQAYSSETSINQIKLGLAVDITGEGFPGITLHGTVTGIDRQKTSDNGQSGFMVDIIVKNVSPKLQKAIHFGSPVTVAIKIPPARKMLIPIHSVIQDDSGNWVEKIDPKTGLPHKIFIQTSGTLKDYVEVISGLQEGDIIKK